jgi:hypothetical protein
MSAPPRIIYARDRDCIAVGDHLVEVRTVDPEQPVVLAAHESKARQTAVIPQSVVRREFVGAVEQEEFIQ